MIAGNTILIIAPLFRQIKTETRIIRAIPKETFLEYNKHIGNIKSNVYPRLSPPKPSKVPYIPISLFKEINNLYIEMIKYNMKKNKTALSVILFLYVSI